MRSTRAFRLIALAVFAVALCASVAPLCFDSIDCVHGCSHGSSALGSHSASVGMTGLIVMGVTAIVAMTLRTYAADARPGRRPSRTAAVSSAPCLLAVPLRI